MARTQFRGTQVADGSDGIDLTVDVFNTLPVANGGTASTTPGGARSNLGLGNVDNTSDANKPVSSATQIALNKLSVQEKRSGLVPELYQTFAGYTNGSSVPTTSTSGHPIHWATGYGAAPSFSDGTAYSTATSFLCTEDMGADVTALSARFVIAVNGGGNSGLVCLAITDRKMTSDNSQVNMAAHFWVTPTTWAMTVWTGGGVGQSVLKTGTFAKRLVADSSTEYNTQVWVDGEYMTAVLPDGQRVVARDSRVASFHGSFGFVEFQTLNAGDDIFCIKSATITSGITRPPPLTGGLINPSDIGRQLLVAADATAARAIDNSIGSDAVFGTDNRVLRSDGVGRNSQGSAVTIADDGSITLPALSGQTWSAWKLWADNDNKCFTATNDDSDVSMQIGQEVWVRVKNVTGSTIPNGTPVYVSGQDSGWPTVGLAKADNANTVVAIGLTTEAIANNAIGFVTALGVVNGLNTSAFTAGQTVYLSSSTAGALTSTLPTAPNFRYRIGKVMVSSSTAGTIHVTPSTAALGDGVANQIIGFNTSASQEVKTLVSGANIIVHTAGQIAFNVPADQVITHTGGTITRAVGTGDFATGLRVGRAFTATSVIYQFGTADASGSTTVELRRNGAQVASSNLTITAANQADGTGTDTARTATINQAFAVGDRIALQITGIGTTPGKGLRAWVVGTYS